MQNKFSLSRSGKPLFIGVLLVSIIINLFLLGVLAGGAGIRHKHFALMALASPHGEYMAEWVGHYLQPADATVLKAAVQAQAEALKQAHADVHTATKNVASVFEDDPPDAAALQTAFDQLATAKTEVNDVVEKIIQDVYPKLSPDGRHRLAEMTRY